jgi:4-amino-4-deoxy-L-arabinose transferase-like glycosyltransferase
MDFTMITRVTDPPLEISPLALPAARSLRIRRRWLVAVAAAAIGAGAFLRLYDLGRFGFWTDEFYHVFAAKSYLENGTLDVPMKGEYTRAAPITLMTAASFKLFGVSETAARLPFALASVAFLIIAFFLVRRMTSLPLATAFTVAMSLAPFCISMARECRMYVILQLFYFLAVAFFAAGFEGGKVSQIGGGPLARFAASHQLHFGRLLTSALCFVAAASAQALAFNFGLVLIAYSAVMLGWTVHHYGWRSREWTKYGFLLAFLGLSLAVLVVALPGVFHNLIFNASYVPDWMARKEGNALRYFLSDRYPGLFFLFPLGAVLLVRRYGKAGLLFALNFAVLFPMHSFVFGRREDRYIFYIFPYFVLAAAAAVEVILPAVAQALRRYTKGRSAWATILIVAAALPAVNLIAYPWLGNAKNVLTSYRFPDWKTLPPRLLENMAASGAITTIPREYLYYVGAAPTYYFLSERDPEQRYEPGLITTPAEFTAALADPRVRFLISNAWAFENDAYINDAMRAYVRETMHEVDHGGDPRLVVFEKIDGTPR